MTGKPGSLDGNFINGNSLPEYITGHNGKNSNVRPCD